MLKSELFGSRRSDCMLSSLLQMSLRQRVLVVVLALALAIGGIYSFKPFPSTLFLMSRRSLVQVVTKTLTRKKSNGS